MKDRVKETSEYSSNLISVSYTKYITNPSTNRRDTSVFLKLVRQHVDAKRKLTVKNKLTLSKNKLLPGRRR